MKYKNQIKLLSQICRINTIWFSILFLLILSPSNLFSQELQFKNIPLSQALIQVSEKLDAKIAFNSDELSKKNVTKNISSTDINDVLDILLENTGFTYELKHGSYLIINLKEDIAEIKQPVQLKGIVIDRSTGERLPYASVSTPDDDYSVSTTVNGTFQITTWNGKSVRLRISYLGYYSLDTLVQLENNNLFSFFALSQSTQSIETIDITGEKVEMVDFSDQAGHMIFNPSRFGDFPNYGEVDVFRSLQLLPGISYSENSSQLNIRGGSPDQNLVLFDGFTLYNLDHFFGVFSALNPYVIKNIQVYKGGFDSKYGERISGIVDITGKSGNQLKPTFYGGVNLISANLTAEIPISKKLTVIAAARRAYSDLYSTYLSDQILKNSFTQRGRFPNPNVNEIEPDFYFGDFNTKISYEINPQENLSLSIYGAKDNLDNSNTSVNNDFDVDTKDINEWGNYGFGFSWKKQWSGNYYSDVQFGHSGYFNDYYNNTVILPPPGQDTQNETFTRLTNEKNHLIDYFLTWKHSYYIHPQNQFDFGITAKYNEYSFYKDADKTTVYDDISSSAMLYSLFLQDKILSGKRFVLKPGLRLNLYGKTQKLYFEPRFSASYKLNERFLLKMATGRYYQYLNKSTSEQKYGYNRDFWVLADDINHPVVSSNHFIFGGSYEASCFYFDVEGYYKTVDGLEEYLFFNNDFNNSNDGSTPPPAPNTSQLSRFVAGSGKVLGLDVLIKYEKNNYSSWLAYSLSKAVQNFENINRGEDIPAPYDQTNELKWINLYSYNKWNFSSLTLYTTGRPYLDSSQKDENFQSTRVYERLPDYFRIDLSANYTFNLKKVSIKPGLSIINLLNTKNYLTVYKRQIPTGDNNTFIDETTFVNSPGMSFNFFVNFRF